MREQGSNCNRQNQWNGNSRQVCRNRNTSYYNSIYQNRQNYPQQMQEVCDCVESNKNVAKESTYECQNQYEMCIDRMRPGMGYVPWQKFQQLIEAEEALKKGTIFKELVLPYEGNKGRGGNCNG